jgi:hypothetical protein
MVLDPMSALSLAGNVVQFVSFSTGLVSGAYAIYHSSEGTSMENLELEFVTENLKQFSLRLSRGSKFPSSSFYATSPSSSDESLRQLSKSCKEVADELLSVLNDLKVNIKGEHRKWDSFRQALKSVWKKDKIELRERSITVSHLLLRFFSLCLIGHLRKIVMVSKVIVYFTF